MNGTPAMSLIQAPRADSTIRALDWRSSVPLAAGVAFLTAMVGLASDPVNKTIVVYALSFWHYWIYALAFLFRSAPLSVFKRDAVLTRTVSLFAFGWVYFALPLSLPSLVVVGLGLLLNMAAVRALGVDRTYYGYELEELPPKRVVAFPYSWIPHPMLVGNMTAFGGALLNDDFRLNWQPLAVAHVLLNLAIILMEAYVKPERRSRTDAGEPLAEIAEVLLRSFLWGVAGGLAGAAFAHLAGRADLEAAAAFAGGCSAAYGAAMVESYSSPRSAKGFRDRALNV
jgi:hypothetical protein